MKRTNIFFMALYIMIAVVGFLSIKGIDKYSDGKIPTFDENKYIMIIKEDVFRQAFNENQWIDIVNKRSSNTMLQLCISLDSVSDNSIFDNIIKTAEDFTMFKWDTVMGNNSRLLYFSLPMEPIEKEKFDYVNIPTWLMSTLIDENILDINTELISQKRFFDFAGIKRKKTIE